MVSETSGIFAGLSNWWRSLSPREHVLLLLASGLATGILLWFAVLQPLAGVYRTAQSDYAAAEARFARIQAKAQIIRRNNRANTAASAIPPSNVAANANPIDVAAPLDQQLQTSMAAAGFEVGAITAQRGGQQALVTINSAVSSALLPWLVQVEAQAIVVRTLDLQALADGRVRARIVFERRTL
jgi:type II secretory pathway component PulM